MIKFVSRVFVPAALAMACASPSGPPSVVADPGQLPTTPSRISAGNADVVLSQPDTTQVVRVGQTVGVKPLRDQGQWQVSFAAASLDLLTPMDRLSDPGPGGWVWRAVAPGLTEISFTSTAPCPAPPCAPNVLRFSFTLDITDPR